MFNIAWSELAVILVVALVIINPKDLPEIMGAVGRFIGKAKRTVREFTETMEQAAGADAIKQFKDQIEKEQAVLTKIVGDDGKEYHTYDVGGLVDVSRKIEDEGEKSPS